MSDATGTPQEVAFRLLVAVAKSEHFDLSGAMGTQKPTREWVLKTYAQCLAVVSEPNRVEEWLTVYQPPNAQQKAQ